MMRPRLWVVSELYYPEETSTGYFLTRIAEGLAADFDVHVVCAKPSYSERGLEVPRREERRGTVIHRMRSTHFDKDRLALRLVNLLTFTLATLVFAMRRFRRGDRVLVVTNPPTIPVVLAAVCRLKRCRSLLLVHDVYPDILAALNIVRRGSRLFRLLDQAFSAMFRAYDRIVVLGRDMRDVIASKLPDGDARITIIPNWGDVDEIAPIPRDENEFRLAHGLKDRFVVQFSGNIGRTHDVSLLLEAARLVEDDPSILFLFVGYGGKANLVEAVQRPNVMALPRQPRARLNAMLASSDLTVISFVEGMYGLSVPSRMYNIMAAGVPIAAVADPNSELGLAVAEEGCGWVLPQGDATALADLVREIAPHGSKRGGAGRRAVERLYNLHAVRDAYRAVLR